MKNFGTIIDNFDAVTKQYVDNKVPTDEHIKGIKVDNATLADTAKKVQNAFTYKAHDKTDGTAVSISYDGSEAASLDFVADDFAPVYTSGNDLGLKLVDKGYATKTYVDNQDVLKLDKAGGSITGNLTVGGNLTINGTTTTVDSTTLQVKDKLIEVAHGNTTTLTTPAGLVAPKYDGTNSGALVFDSTGTAYVGDVTLKDGNIDVANSDLQPLATRTGLVGGNLVQYDSSAQTLKDSGKKISDLALKTDIPTDYVTTDTDQDIKGKKTVVPPSNKDNSNQIATTAWAGRRYKSIADFGFTSQTTVKAIVQKIIDNWYEYCTFACTNDNFNNFSDTPDGYGTLIIDVGSNALRPFISFTKQIGDSNSYKHWQANIVRGENNQISEIQWYELALKKDIPTDYVKYTAQTLTNAQKSQARSNIGSGTSNFSGNYSDLENIPTDIAKIGNLSNPNLFINPNFAINQRGQSEYTNTAKKYTVDRTYSNRSVITPLQGGGIKLNVLSGQSNPYIQQVVEHATALVGKRLAFSCCINGVVGKISIPELIPSENSTTNVFVNKNFSVGAITCNIQFLKYKPQTADDSVLQVTFTISNPNDTIISWWKLEVGSVATEFSPPSIAEELQKCYRYYKKITNLQGASYAAVVLVYGDGAGARMLVENTFRKNPTVITNGAFVVTVNGEYKTVSAMKIQSFNSTNVVVKLTLNAGITEGVCGYLQSNNSPDAYIALDAEI